MERVGNICKHDCLSGSVRSNENNRLRVAIIIKGHCNFSRSNWPYIFYVNFAKVHGMYFKNNHLLEQLVSSHIWFNKVGDFGA